jgi:hypothetical protein
MIPYSETFDQSPRANMIEYDALVQRYYTFFSLIGWTPIERA